MSNQHTDWLNALLGGGLIGIAASLLLLWSGRIAGISGIAYGLIKPTKGEVSWRASFLGGLLLGGIFLNLFRPEAFGGDLATPDGTVLLAGVLVGFGTVLGSGCTSGHGVCGISRISPRSLLATVLFISSGVLMVMAMKVIGVIQ